jgi:hypothetical protein
MSEQNIHLLTSKSGVLHENNFHCYYESLVSYTEWNEKIYLGNEFVCKFCGGTNRSQFKRENAHSFPAFAGNKWLFSKDECKECNQTFSLYENELANFGLVMRTLYGMKTKKGGATKYKSNAYSLQRDQSGLKMTIYGDNGKIIQPEKDGSVEFNMDFANEEHSVDFTIPEKEYIPLYLFKALVKIAFSIMPRTEDKEDVFNELKSLLRVVDSSFTQENYKPYFYIYHSKFSFIKRNPFLCLFKKHPKYHNHNIPTYSFLFSYGNQAFQIFLPYFSGDRWLLNEKELKLLIIPELIVEKEKKGVFTWMNGFNKDKIRYTNKV